MTTPCPNELLIIQISKDVFGLLGSDDEIFTCIAK